MRKGLLLFTRYCDSESNYVLIWATIVYRFFASVKFSEHDTQNVFIMKYKLTVNSCEYRCVALS